MLRCGCRIVIAMPSLPDDPDRYHARPVDVFDWCVWDIRRNEPVFGSDMLREDEARRTAHRMSQAYRRAMSPIDIAYEAAHS
jgi:hypothetical protein